MPALNQTATADHANFARLMIKRLADKGWPTPVTYQADTFSLKISDGQVLYLDNTYRDWLNADDAVAKQAAIDRMVDITLESRHQTTAEEDRANLMLGVRSRTYVENMWLFTKVPPDYMDGAYKPFVADLAAVLIVDSEKAMAICTREKLAEWQAGFDDLVPIARDHLKRVPTRFEKTGSGIYVSSGSNDYDSSALLTPDVFTSLPLKGEPIVVPVLRNLLLVAGSEDAEALRQIGPLAEKLYDEDSRPLSVTPLILKDGVFAAVDTSNGAFPMLRRLAVRQPMQDYADLRLALEPHFAAQKRDTYIGKLEAIESDGSLYTWTTLVHDIASLIPKADAVIISQGDDTPPLVRRWADLMAVCGDVATEPRVYPPLYAFPKGLNAAHITSLKKSSAHPAWFPDLSRMS